MTTFDIQLRGVYRTLQEDGKGWCVILFVGDQTVVFNCKEKDMPIERVTLTDGKDQTLQNKEKV